MTLLSNQTELVCEYFTADNKNKIKISSAYAATKSKTSFVYINRSEVSESEQLLVLQGGRSNVSISNILHNFVWRGRVDPLQRNANL